MHQTKHCMICQKPVHFDIGLVLDDTILCAACDDRRHAAQLAEKQNRKTLMGAIIINTDGTVKPVKNLGWLLKNWKLVTEFEVIAMERGEGLMIAHLKDGRKYSTNWASFSHCRTWLHRPVFIGVPLQFGDEPTVC